MRDLKILEFIKKKIESCSADYLFEVLIYFVSGFVLGLVIKHSTRYFLWFLIFSIISFWAIQNFGLISINQDCIKDLMSFSQKYSLSQVFDAIIDFVNNHIAESLALILGFYLSWEIL